MPQEPITAVISAIGFVIFFVLVIGFIVKDAMNRFKNQ